MSENKKIQNSESFTGERLVLGKAGNRIEKDHIERYRFAGAYIKNKTVLDIACGTGYGSDILISSGAESYLGVDISQESIQFANNSYSSGKSRFIVGDICDISLDGTFDIVVCFETIEHVHDYKRSLQNISSLLRPGGMVIVSSPNRPITSPQIKQLKDRPSNPFHNQEFTPAELTAELMAAGFHVRGIFGQRQRRPWTLFLRRSLFLPDLHALFSSPVVTPVDTKIPRYFIITAEKRPQ